MCLFDTSHTRDAFYLSSPKICFTCPSLKKLGTSLAHWHNLAHFYTGGIEIDTALKWVKVTDMVISLIKNQYALLHQNISKLNKLLFPGYSRFAVFKKYKNADVNIKQNFLLPLELAI